VEELQGIVIEAPPHRIQSVRRNQHDTFAEGEILPLVDHDRAIAAGAVEQDNDRQGTFLRGNEERGFARFAVEVEAYFLRLDLRLCLGGARSQTEYCGN
jgi:hypothetical protein